MFLPTPVGGASIEWVNSARFKDLVKWTSFPYSSSDLNASIIIVSDYPCMQFQNNTVAIGDINKQ